MTVAIAAPAALPAVDQDTIQIRCAHPSPQ